MGRRHQVFLIARLVPFNPSSPPTPQSDNRAYYRCIGAHHNQYSYEDLVLAATRRFLTLLQNPCNAEIVRDELRRVQGVYPRNIGYLEAYWRRERRIDALMRRRFDPESEPEEPEEEKEGQGRPPGPKIPMMPCPYTLFLLAQAWDMDLSSLKNAYASGSGFEYSSLDPDIGSFGFADNNDGITVIDVTDPSDPAYCYIVQNSDGTRIMNMMSYMANYEDLDKLFERIKRRDYVSEDLEIMKAMSDLDNVRVLGLDHDSNELGQVWPDEYGREDDQEPEFAPEEDALRPSVPSLVEIAIKRALATDEVGQLEHLPEMSRHLSGLVNDALKIRNALPDSAVPLLINILISKLKSTNDFVLDLTSYPCITSEQISTIAQDLSNNPDIPSIKTVNLSGNHAISTSAIIEILKAFPRLFRLVLLNTNISDESLLELLSTYPQLFHNLYDLVHPAFLHSVGPEHWPEGHTRRVIPETLHPAYRHGITFVTANDRGHSQDVSGMGSIALFNPIKLVKTLSRHLRLNTSPKVESESYFGFAYVQSRTGALCALSSGINIAASDEVREPEVLIDGGYDWYSRSVVCIPRTQSLEAFFGVGWLFVLEYRGRMLEDHAEAGFEYGFVKVDKEALERQVKEEKEKVQGETDSIQKSNGDGLDGESSRQLSHYPDAGGKTLNLTSDLYQIFDVRGFLKEMEKEGRPVPVEDDIVEFERALKGHDLVESSWAGVKQSSRYTDTSDREKPRPARLMSNGTFEKLTRTADVANAYAKWCEAL